MSLTLGSASKVSLASRKFLSNRSTSDFRYLPARSDGDRTIKYSSSELGMRGMPVDPSVLHAFDVGLMEVSGCSLLRLVATDGGLVKRSWRVWMFV